MNVATLLDKLPILTQCGPTDLTVTALCNDSRQARSGAAFFALRGLTQDGHDYIPQALQQGAKIIFMERPVLLPADCCGIVVVDCRKALSQAAAEFYDHPETRLCMVGVTGTNGKTTTTYLLEAILRAAGQAPAVLGTVSYRFNALQQEASHTTPDAIELFAALATFQQHGATAAVMEVSSHALHQYRVEGISFDAAVFTNLTPEHLDYHADMEEYFAAKRLLFAERLKPGARAALCIDDAYGERLASEFPQAITCGLAPQAAVHPQRIKLSLDGIHGTFASPLGLLRIDSRLVGPFNLQNLLCAVAAGVALNLPATAIEAGIAAAHAVPGRLERVENERGALILVDYAHTGDALDKALAAVTSLQPQRIITVFGCGGDRDRRKRPVMGEVAARHSDLAIVTSDNPRTEDPHAIIAEIEKGVQQIHSRRLSETEARQGGNGYLVVPDRRQAIRLAVSLLAAGDLLLVAGKGHEDYQIIGKEKFHFDDREELRAALSTGGPA
ncbi:MAG: UDP-N-acetylmuramoyl-L-alanyl-D-glutamate--2,6-diaminopimelate ligase [Desulfuromonadales bacterium]|nr:UDP-N-acetylmuramoyl-L-alanyl-D-glutamate--2,6-diaminopimelate ligase [Desulfuromonadales bacterium]